MTDTVTLRALAARVETEAPSRELQEAIASGLGYSESAHSQGWWQLAGTREWDWLPLWLTSIDAAVALMPVGWTIVGIMEEETGMWCAEALPRETRVGIEEGNAPTEPQARAALALRCMAADLEQETKE